MDTQKIVRKYLWYDLIANLSFGLVAMFNSLNSLIKTDALKTVVSIAGFINATAIFRGYETDCHRNV